MPSVVTELEKLVDEFARTSRWIEGEAGLVQALQAEKYDFRTYEAQVMLKEAADRGKSALVKQLLDAGVPLNSLAAPASREPIFGGPYAGLLTSAGS